MLCLAGCDGEPVTTPKDAVTAYFQAIADKDCGALTRVTGGKVLTTIKKHGCDEMFRHVVALERIEGDKPDGRDPSLRNVTVRLVSRKDAAVLAVRLIEGRWRVTRN